MRPAFEEQEPENLSPEQENPKEDDLFWDENEEDLSDIKGIDPDSEDKTDENY